MGLFDKLSDGVAKGLGQTERALEIGRLKSQISLVTKQRDEAVMALGRAVYRSYRENRFSDPEYAAALSQIREMEVSLGRLETEITGLKAQSPGQVCAACGTANATDAKFCIGCGVALVQVPTKTCSSCGAEVNADVAFCGRCGSAFGVDAEPEGPAYAESPGPLPEPEADAVAPAAEPEISSGTRCQECGHEGEPGEKFCGACGHSFVQ